MDTQTPLLSAKRDFNRLGLSLLAMALIPLLVQLVLAFVIALLTPSVRRITGRCFSSAFRCCSAAA